MKRVGKGLRLAVEFQRLMMILMMMMMVVSAFCLFEEQNGKGFVFRFILKSFRDLFAIHIFQGWRNIIPTKNIVPVSFTGYFNFVIFLINSFDI